MHRQSEGNFFKRNFQTIAKAGIILIPTIYTTLFLGSMWDPYGNVDKLPVAVVNQDHAVEYQGKTLSIGEELSDKLKEKNALDFHFVDSRTANSGLQNGTYYMVITIPENFSGNAATLLEEHPQKMELQYATNPGTNYIASKMSESALAKIEKEVSASVTESYVETLFDQFGDIGDGFTEAADGAMQIKDGTNQLKNGNTTITDNLRLLADSTLTFQNGAETLEAGLSEYTSGVSQINDGAKSLNEGIGTLSIAAGSGIGKLSAGASALESGILEYTAGAELAADGAGKLFAGTQPLSDGLDSYTNGVAEVSAGADTLCKGAETLSDGISAYTAGVAAASAGAAKIDASSSALTTGSQFLCGGTEQLSEAGNAILNGMHQISTGLDESMSEENHAQLQALNTGLTTLQNGIQKLNDSVSVIELPDTSTASQTLATSVSGIAADASTAGKNLTAMEAKLRTLAASHPELLTDADFLALTETVSDCASQIMDMGEKLQQMQTAGQSISALSGMRSTVDTLKASVEALNTGAEQVLPAARSAASSLENGLMTVQSAFTRTGETPEEMGLVQAMTVMNESLDSLSNGAGSLENGIAEYTAGVGSVSGGLAQINAKSADLTNGAAALNSGASALNGGLLMIQENTPSLLNGFQTYSAGISELNDGMIRLTENTSALSGGAGTLTNGIRTLDSSLTDGVSQLADGSAKLYAGTSRLTENEKALNEGAAQLTNGAGQIHDGAQKLADGSVELGDGIVKLSDGAEELHTALSDGAKEISEISADEETYSMFSSPVNSIESFCTEVPTNGNAMAAYMMAVGLWVAGLAFCIILEPQKRKIGENATLDWAKQVGELCGLAIAQAVVMVLLLKVFNGFAPQYLGNTILVACVASVAFLLLEYTVNYCAGVIGDFLLLVFMVIQLSGCAGTYPKELSDVFYQLINPLLPFTYTVHGFRSGIASGLSIAADILMLATLGIISAIVLLVGFRIRCRHEATKALNALEVTA
ncbi:MAG: YhgE/Pip domain-containing protein [Oscillospiraceae bacterium]|nr:YhgE/Pip domain-containing protein [Oscillospiraceae bacterium]